MEREARDYPSHPVRTFSVAQSGTIPVYYPSSHVFHSHPHPETMPSDYRILKFHQSAEAQFAFPVMWVMDATTSEVAYCIEDRGETLLIRRQGPMSDGVGVATLYRRQQITVAYGNGKEFLPTEILRTDLRGDKIFINGNGQYKWVRTQVGGSKSWFEVVDPVSPQKPFARLRVLGDEASQTHLLLELSIHICLHSFMCDGLITAIVLMLHSNDAWIVNG